MLELLELLFPNNVPNTNPINELTIGRCRFLILGGRRWRGREQMIVGVWWVFGWRGFGGAGVSVAVGIGVQISARRDSNSRILRIRIDGCAHFVRRKTPETQPESLRKPWKVPNSVPKFRCG